MIRSVFVSILTATRLIRLACDMHIRDVLLLMFFSSIGLTSKFKTLLDGGKELAL